MRRIHWCTALLSFGVSALAQPSIRPASVVNAANNLAAALPNSGLARGGMFVLKGRNLGAKGTVIASSFPLQTSMGGTSMKITIGSTTADVIMVYVVGGLSDDQGPFDQLAGIVPSNTPTGNGTLTVTYNNTTSASVPVTVLANAFGIFSINQQGMGPGVFTDPNFKVNTLVNAAHPGDQLFIWGTGLGAISGNDANAPPVGNLNVPVNVYVGGVKAVIGYQGRSGCCSGIDQILITVPAGVTGCYVPVAVTAGGVVSNFTTMSVAASGNICSDDVIGGYSAADLQKVQTNTAFTVATPGVFRFNANLTIPGMGTLQGVADSGSGYFQHYGGASGVLSALPVDPFPSVGCVVYTRQSNDNAFFNTITLSPAHDYVGLDGGPALNISGPNGNKQMLRQNTGTGGSPDFRYKADLGGDQPFTTAGPAYLVQGTYTVSNGSGGADVGGFTASVTIPNNLGNPWANQDAITTISRSQDLMLTFNPPGNNLAMAILGDSYDPARGWYGIINCLVPPGATSFTIPSYVLAGLPAAGLSSDLGGVRTAFLGVGVGTAGPRIQARGVDSGSFSWFDLFIKNVNVQ